MTVTVGVVGTGSIGSDQVRRLSARVSGARVGAVFDVDTARADAVAAAVVRTRRSPFAAGHLADPQLVLLVTGSGVAVEVEVFLHCRYGYDVRCEIVGATGTVSPEVPTTGGVLGRAVPADWRERFGGAYHAELQQWVDGVRAGTVAGPDAGDGYTATAVAEAGVGSPMSGRDTTVALAERPALYA
ncbi:MAG TPA: Gfo/Idh/MocA family oxidoreductase [Mycobacteriales bacterium]|nr:Gfo/Idh/MocA family oxidoreductase [Mycobacteriales bacterium]